MFRVSELTSRYVQVSLDVELAIGGSRLIEKQRVESETKPWKVADGNIGVGLCTKDYTSWMCSQTRYPVFQFIKKSFVPLPARSVLLPSRQCQLQPINQINKLKLWNTFSGLLVVSEYVSVWPKYALPDLQRQQMDQWAPLQLDYPSQTNT